MDGGAWGAIVHGVAGGGHDLAIKPPPAPQKELPRLDSRLGSGSGASRLVQPQFAHLPNGTNCAFLCEDLMRSSTSGDCFKQVTCVKIHCSQHPGFPGE